MQLRDQLIGERPTGIHLTPDAQVKLWNGVGVWLNRNAARVSRPSNPVTPSKT